MRPAGTRKPTVATPRWSRTTTTNDLGYATAPVALDTCILIRNTARRMLAGVQEACSSWILLPQESIRECNVPYAAVAGKRIRRRLEREALVRWGRD